MTDQSLDLEDEQADLWAKWHGFNDADELKEWGKQAERERLTEQASKKGGDG